MTGIAVFMTVMGIGIAGTWTLDIVRGGKVDRSGGLLRAREPGGGLLLPHWLAEYTTAAGLLLGAVAIMTGVSWGPTVAGAALSATWSRR